jgi:hypothetical protein
MPAPLASSKIRIGASGDAALATRTAEATAARGPLANSLPPWKALQLSLPCISLAPLRFIARVKTSCQYHPGKN